jgi:hypothetical protein
VNESDSRRLADEARRQRAGPPRVGRLARIERILEQQIPISHEEVPVMANENQANPAQAQATANQGQGQPQSQGQATGEPRARAEQVARQLHAELQALPAGDGGGAPGAPHNVGAPSVGGFFRDVVSELNFSSDEIAAFKGVPEKFIRAIVMAAMKQVGA